MTVEALGGRARCRGRRDEHGDDGEGDGAQGGRHRRRRYSKRQPSPEANDFRIRRATTMRCTSSGPS